VTVLFDQLCQQAARQRATVVELGRAHAQGHEVFFVRDNGAGLGVGALAGLFDPRADGTGLAVARSIAVRHGGVLWAESTVGYGTTVLFRLETLEAGH
jgi:signal transduction histidine kinase